MSGGATGYAALNARVRVMYSTLLTSQELNGLYEAPDFNALLALLKSSPYGPYLAKMKDRDESPRKVAFHIRERLTDVYPSIIHSAPEHARSLLLQRYR